MSLFGKPTPNPASIFGGSGGRSITPASVFGSHSPQSNANSIFGSHNSTKSAQSVFGQASKYTTPSSVFGIESHSNAFQALSTGDDDMNSDTTPAKSLFSNHSEASRSKAASLFGSYGTSGPAPQSVFGAGNTTSTPKSLFGNSKANSDNPSVASPTAASIFSQTTATQPKSVFGNSSQTTAQTVFESSNASPASVFGNQQTSVTPASVFGKSQSTTPSLFGSLMNSHSSTAQPSQAAASLGATHTLFGKSKVAGNTLFGKSMNPASEVDSDKFYSKESDLSAAELAAFMADVFSIGCIPMKLPPRSACI